MGVLTRSTFQFFWGRNRADSTQTRKIAANFRSGVSLHSHTMFSEECLDMIPRYTGNIPYLGSAIRAQQAEYSRRKGRDFDFSRAFWTPPLNPRQAYRLEEKQIQRQFQLPALVSLTDHDDVRAAGLLRVMNRFRHAPVSTEWTIPFENTFFHLGIHNLPAESAKQMQEEFTILTDNPCPEAILSMLRQLNDNPEILVVFNHPLWDEKGIGLVGHKRALTRFLDAFGSQFHALELNGLRSWHENKDVAALARALDLPVISGGDRHGREPNAILNLSEADRFPDFVREIREERRSHVIFMPQYREPLKLRVLQTMVDVVREYPENVEGRRLWSDRVFFRDPVSSTVSPLTAIWKDGGPRIVRHFIKAMRFVERRSVRSALRLALDDRRVVWSDGEASI
jgi:hypothetical protein